jgi:hypothetical protein
MGAVEFFASLAGFWWVLLILLTVMVAVYGLVFYWQRTTPILLKKVPRAFHQIQTECRKIIAETRAYAPEDPLPYGPLVAGIQRQVDNIANQLVPLKSRYIDIQNRVRSLHLRSWKMLIGAPFYLFSWYSIQGSIRQLLHDHDELRKLVDVVWHDIADMKRQAWLVAVKAREIYAREREIRRLIDNLSDKKLFGDTFELAASQEESVIEALERIPEYFLLADEEAISKLSTKETVCQVYTLLNQVEPVLEELSDKLSLWNAEYKRLSEKAKQVHQQMDLVEHLLANKPEGIDTTDESNRLRAICSTVDVLVATLSRLEIESFPLVDEELDRAQMLLIEIGRQVRKALRQYPSLKAFIGDLLIVQKECADVFDSLIKSTQYPLQWNRSQHEFLELNKATNNIRLDQKSRTLEQIDQDLIIVEDLSMRWATLRATLNQIVAQHNELLEILDRDVIQYGSERLLEYRLLSEQTAAYHPNNWQKSDAVSSFADDIARVDAHQRVVQGRDSTQSIFESELSDWITQVNSLIQGHETLRIRSEKIRARLEWLRMQEEKAREQFQTSWSLVNQMTWIVNSNTFLKQKVETDFKRIQMSLDRLRDELENSSQGIIEVRASSVRSTYGEIVLIAKGWLDKLNQEIDRKRTILEHKVDRLNQIAKLADPIFEKIQHLLVHEERRGIQDNTAPLLQLSAEELLLELKGRSIVWQELVAVQEELEEIVETPLLDSYSHASEQREKVLAALERALQKIPEPRAWPPSSVSITQEKNEFDLIEGKWRALNNKQMRAIWAVRQYGELAGSYQVLAGKLKGVLQRATQEQDKVLGLEKEIGRLLHLWQQKGQGYTEDPLVLEQIRDLRARANLALDHLKQKWVSPSGRVTELLTYQELIQGIEEITRFLKTTSITVNQADGEPFEIQLQDAQTKSRQVDRSLL